MSGIEITRRDLTVAELRASAGKCRDATAARRMLALALVLEGVDRTRTAETYGMDRPPFSVKPSNSFLPSDVTPMITRIHSASGSIRACR